MLKFKVLLTGLLTVISFSTSALTADETAAAIRKAAAQIDDARCVTCHGPIGRTRPIWGSYGNDPQSYPWPTPPPWVLLR